MKKIILLIAVLTLLTLSACSLEGESPTWDHLQNQDPSKIHRDTDNQDVETSDNPRCNGEYTTEDIIYRDYEIRAQREQNIELCYEIPEEPLIITCPGQATIIYYDQARCVESLSE